MNFLPRRRDLPFQFLMRTAALCVSAVLIFGDAGSLSAQPPPPQARQRIPAKKKSKKRRAAPCNTADCKLSTTAPEITSPTPDDAAAQAQLGSLARGLHTATPGTYDKLSVFATKNAATVWGARAALALGYEDYIKNRLPQAMNWFTKAKNDTLLREYVLFWTAQTRRSQKNLPGAFADLQTFQQDFPSSAMREQFLEAYAPTALDTGHAKEAIEALNAYAPTNTRPALLLERAQAYKAARQLTRAAKDYQTLYYKYPLSDEAKAAGTSLPQISRELGRNIRPPTLEMQLQRAQTILMRTSGKMPARNMKKSAALLRDPAHPKRQLAQLRIAQTKLHPRDRQQSYLR